jgi:hypothetical protein
MSIEEVLKQEIKRANKVINDLSLEIINLQAEIEKLKQEAKE